MFFSNLGERVPKSPPFAHGNASTAHRMPAVENVCTPPKKPLLSACAQALGEALSQLGDFRRDHRLAVSLA